MTFLHDPTWQFIITISTSIVISTITSGITIWLTLRKPILPIGSSILEIETVQGAENIKAIKERMQIPLGDETSNTLFWLTFEIWNNGKDTIQLANPTPLIIGFRQGIRVLGWDRLERDPNYVKAIPRIEDGEVKVELPFLDPKQSITMHLLLSDYVDRFEYIRAEVPVRKRFAQANNRQSARQYRIAGVIATCFGIFCTVFFYFSLEGTLADKLYTSVVMGGSSFLIGIGFLSTSYFEKRHPPHHNPPLFERIKSELKSFLSTLPAIIAIGIIITAIYFFFGSRTLINCVVTLAIIGFPALVWMGIYGLAKWILKKVKVNYTPIVIIIVTGVIPVIVLLREILLFSFIWARP